MKKLAVEVWSDIACPWCYVGKRRLEAALALFARRDAVDLTWRAFELDPSAPRVREPQPYAERLAKKYGASAERSRDMVERMADVARADGLDFRFDRIRPGNTFDAHRLLHLAAERGRQDALKERFLRAYLSEGEPIGDPAALARLAAEAGLDPAEVAGVLGGDAYAREVRADEAAAREYGIGGVPFFVIGRYGVSGAQPAEALLEVLNRAWAEAEAAAAPAPFAASAACGPEGCA